MNWAPEQQSDEHLKSKNILELGVEKYLRIFLNHRKKKERYASRDTYIFDI